MALDAKTVENAKKREKPYRLSDGGGLLLQVNKSGSKDWLVRVTIAGKRRDMGIGGWPVVSLAQARAKALAVRRDIEAGLDPIEKQREDERKAKADREAREEEDKRIFEATLDAYLKAEAPSWKTAKTAKSWRASLKQHAAPIMRLPVGKICGEDVGNVLSPIWHEKPVMAGKVRRRIAAVLDYAARKGWRDEKNPAHASRLKDLGLSKQAQGRNQPSLPWAKLPAFMAALDGEAGMAPLALRFLILTALRSSEGRACRWSWVSFDQDGPTLTIPPEAMKGRKTWFGNGAVQQ